MKNKGMGMRTKAAAAGVSALALLLAACGTDDGNGDDAATTETATETATDATTEESSDGGTESSTETSAAEGGDGAAEACADASGTVEEVTGPGGSPTIGVPRPDGWDRASDFESDMIPLAMANQGLTADGFAPSAVLTVEQSDLGGSDEFDRQAQMVETIAEEGSASLQPIGETCGHESQILEYQTQAPGDIVTDVTALMVSVPADSGFTTVVLSVQSAEPDNPEYAESLQTMTEELQISE
ncbi:hypothetical protein [uncultured Corynebacterium sp.]|uniref:hypothetical protein n=1 Tax=uncultured Corynebacterium sp. TaxID=159447 RepID=UPI0025F006B2|nr:hypothetical protein [uncultured Corynebacterium sp.]